MSLWDGTIVLSSLVPAQEEREPKVKHIAFHARSRISTDRRRLPAYTKANNRTNLQSPVDGTLREDLQHIRSNPLARPECRGELEKLKSRYSRELTILSAVNDSLADALADPDHDAAQQVELIDEDPNLNATSITLRSKDLSSSISALLGGSLDPFIVSVTDLTPRQQSLLQFFVRDYSPTMFGTSETALYSPSQAVGLPSIRYSKIATQWICILADEILHAMNGRERSRELLRQRSNGYAGLKSALRKRDNNFEEALLGIVIAGLVEYSFGDARSQSLHTIAADMLIHSQGSVENAIQAAPDLEPFYIHAQYAFGRCRIPSPNSLETTLEQWVEELQGIITSDRASWRKCDSVRSHLTACQCVALERDVLQMVMQSLKMEESSSFAVGMQLTLLVEVISALAEFSNHCELAIKYFRRIIFICYHSMITTRGSGESCELQAGTFASICSRARRDIIRQEHFEWLLASDSRFVKRHIIVLKPFGYLHGTSQLSVIDCLNSWLQVGGKGGKLLDEGQLKKLSYEVITTWRSC